MSSINKSVPEFETTMLSEPKTRRGILKSIASGMTVMALSGCLNIRKPKKVIKAYNNDQKGLVPGTPNYYATSEEINGDVNGLIVTSFEGRPTKIDGNVKHENNMGTSNSYLQAEIQALYDPDRNKIHTIDNKQVNFGTIGKKLSGIKKDSSFAIVVPKTMSLLTNHLLKKLKTQYPLANLYQISALNKDKQETAIKDVTGYRGYYDYNYKKASFILSFNHDFLGNDNVRLNQIFQFIQNKNNIKFLSFSDSFSITDSKSDNINSHSIHEQENIIFYLANKLVNKYGHVFPSLDIKSLNYDRRVFDTKKIDKILALLIKYRSKAIVSVGEAHSINVHKAVILINLILKNLNKTVHLRKYSFNHDSIFNASTHKDAVVDLKDKIKKGKIKTVISLDVDLSRLYIDYKSLFENLNLVYLTKYNNRLSKISNIVISKTHFLEDWGALISREGHLSIQQPLLEPLYNSQSAVKCLMALMNIKGDVYPFLTKTLTKSGANIKQLKKYGVINQFFRSNVLYVKKINLDKLEEGPLTNVMSVIPSYTLLDGRYSNNAWLQETPDPVSKLTWGNAIYISKQFSDQHNLSTGDVIKVMMQNNKDIKGPVIIIPGQHKNTLTIAYGYGNVFDTTFSKYGISTDHLNIFESYQIKSIKKLNETVILANTQMNHGFDVEPLAADGVKQRILNILKIDTLSSLSQKNHQHNETKHQPHSLFKEVSYDHKHQWGMSIDLNACIGCNTCSVACQAENNIPIVGKEEVIKGREMSWTRVDRYFIENDNHEVTMNYMPVACVHCENAPCEQVCPVNATLHDDQGLNVMTYNRCIGTRYCANNCPYKVRRFNFFDWHQTNPQAIKKNRIHLFDYFKEPAKSQQMQFNPEVTIRMRGVMEKCSYCLQRIKVAQINEKNSGDASYIKNLKTACQEACPTQAIVFGNINDKDSLIHKKRNSERRYDLLNHELNTQPRTIYLSKVVNPVWKSLKKESHHGHS